MRTKRSILNIVSGLGGQLVTIALAFFIPRLIMMNYGSEANGLVVSVTQIIGYLSLLEAGVGAASIQALYRPVSEGDRGRINAILAATSAYYKRTGILYFVAILLLAVAYPFFVRTEIDVVSVMLIVVLSGVGGAVSYYYQGKYKVLLLAEGKSYVQSSVLTVANILNSFIRIVLLLQGASIVAVTATFLGITLLQVAYYYWYIRRHYRWIDLSVPPDYAAIGQKNAAMIHELSYLIFRNTDVLVLTLFTNLKVVSIYVLYSMIYNIVDNFVQTFNGSIKFALGQHFFGDKKKFMRLYDAYETYFIGLVFAILSVVTVLVLPFMRLYTQGIADINPIDYALPLLFAVSKLLMNARSPADNVIDIAGHFKSTQGRSILESAINLAVSLQLAIWLGIYGVLLGTIAALLYRTVDMIVYSNRRLLERNPWLTLRKWAVSVAVFAALYACSRSFEPPVPSYLAFALWAVLLGAVVVPVYFAVLSLTERSSFAFAWQFAGRLLGRWKPSRPVQASREGML